MGHLQLKIVMLVAVCAMFVVASARIAPSSFDPMHYNVDCTPDCCDPRRADHRPTGLTSGLCDHYCCW